jgi:hypothetical protein
MHMPGITADYRWISVLSKIAPSDLLKFNNVEFVRIFNKEQWRVRDLPRFEKAWHLI